MIRTAESGSGYESSPPPVTRISDPSRPTVSWLALVLLLLTGLLVWAHGCHGDRDDELFAGKTAAKQAAGK